MGVIWLGLGWHRLGRELTSIAGRLKSDDRSVASLGSDSQSSGIFVDRLLEAIDDRMRGYSNYIAEMKAQIDEMQIQSLM
jgi:hypothetical protein